MREDRAQRAVVARARKRHDEFGVERDAAIATDVDEGASGRVDDSRGRAQGAAFETAHGTQAAAEEVLEHRVRAAIESLAVTQLGVEGQRVLARQRVVLLELQVGLGVARVAPGAEFAVDPHQAPLGGHQRAVAAVAGPAQRQRDGVAGAAELLGVVLVGLRQEITVFDGGLLDAGAKEHRFEFGKRHAEAHAGAFGDQAVVAVLVVVGARGAVVGVEGSGDAILGEVRVDSTDHQLAVELAGVDVQAQVVAGAKHVFLADARDDGELFFLRVAGAQREVARGLLGHGDGEVDLVG